MSLLDEAMTMPNGLFLREGEGCDGMAICEQRAFGKPPGRPCNSLLEDGAIST